MKTCVVAGIYAEINEFRCHKLNETLFFEKLNLLDAGLFLVDLEEI